MKTTKIENKLKRGRGRPKFKKTKILMLTQFVAPYMALLKCSSARRAFTHSGGANSCVFAKFRKVLFFRTAAVCRSRMCQTKLV